MDAKQYTLGDVIEVLKLLDPDKIVPIGLGVPYSYRGIYEDLAFRPTRNVSVRTMLENAQGALGEVFTGYKGGEYVMDELTRCWLAGPHDSGGETVGKVMLELMGLAPHAQPAQEKGSR
jgi:hypothetical protein